jgi:putative transposase
VFYYIELSSRRIHLAGVTANPNEIWVTQQARQLIGELDDRDTPLRFLIHDNDVKFSKTFDTLFETEVLHIIHTPKDA